MFSLSQPQVKQLYDKKVVEIRTLQLSFNSEVEGPIIKNKIDPFSDPFSRETTLKIKDQYGKYYIGTVYEYGFFEDDLQMSSNPTHFKLN